jgi:hypothetical protein
MHIIHRPSYASKYPPAQGLLLAAGQAVTGYPIVGAWLGAALASSAVCWMAFAWLPPRWAVLAGLLAALHPIMFVWSQGYWGGAVVTCGGALVLGAIPRMEKSPRTRDGLWLGIGIAILANSRPFEGLVMTVAAAATLMAGTSGRKAPGLHKSLPQTVLPVLTVLVPVACLMAYLNWRVTGNALRLPYQAHESAYAVARPFLWLTPSPIHGYRHREMENFHVGWELSAQQAQGSLDGFMAGAAAKARLLAWQFLSWPLLQLALLGAPWLARHRLMRQGMLLSTLFFLALLSETWLHAHYAAPVFGLILVLALQALRYLRVWRRQGRRSGLLCVRGGMVISLVLLGPFCDQLARERNSGWHMERARILDELQRMGGRHLILVRYQPGHSVHEEWVYNNADIDSSQVIWARSTNAEQDQGLREYCRDRRVWLLEVDERPLRLKPLPSDAAAQSHERPSRR